MFDSTKTDLVDLMKKVNEGKLQLPDFQRDWVWNDEDIISLLGSIGRGYPVGALLTLQSGGTIQFKPRVISGAPETKEDPEEFLLDGQQRITSLYQAIFNNQPVRTRNTKGRGVQRFYYLDIFKALNEPELFEDAILSLPAERVKRNRKKEIEIDLSDATKEYEQHLFPLNSIFHGRDWVYEWRKHWEGRDENINRISTQFEQEIFDKISRYKMPIIRLDKSNERSAVCVIFEKVNVGGKKLDAFELLTAIFAAAKFDLRHDWLGNPQTKEPGRLKRIQGIEARRDVFINLASTDFLQACTVLHTMEQRTAARKSGKEGRSLPAVTCKRDAMLQLPIGAYKKYADAIEKGFIEAGRFLNEQKIVWAQDVPYPPQVVALAAVFASLGKESDKVVAREKLERWFWCAVLGEEYSSATESKIARDVPELIDWIQDDKKEPESVKIAYFQLERLDQIKTRQSAAYKGIHALLIKSGCKDFMSGKTVELMTIYDDQMDIHHIFPQKWCKAHGIKADVYNTILNKTSISATTNRIIGGAAPSNYLKKIQDEQGIETTTIDDILRSHRIEPKFLKADDFQGFIEHRRKALAELVQTAMRKDVVSNIESEVTFELDESLEDEIESNEQ